MDADGEDVQRQRDEVLRHVGGVLAVVRPLDASPDVVSRVDFEICATDILLTCNNEAPSDVNTTLDGSTYPV